MSQTLKEQFLSIVRNDIHRQGIEELVAFLEDSDFFEAPASTRFHGCYEGGLVQHCIDVYNSLHDELAFIFGDNYLAVYSEETIAIVSLFHDLCKIGKYKPGTRNVKDPVTKQWHEEPAYFYNEDNIELGHGPASMYAVMRFIELNHVEAQAILWHMGAYDISNYMSLNGLSSTFEKNTLAFALHRADMMATYVTDNQYFVEAPAMEMSEAEEPEMEETELDADGADEEEEQLEEATTGFNVADYDDWSLEDIKAEIEEWGEEPKKRAKRSELLKQLERLMTEDSESE